MGPGGAPGAAGTAEDTAEDTAGHAGPTFYDEVCRHQELLARLPDALLARLFAGRAAAGVTPPELRRNAATMLGLLRRARVYVLEAEAARCAEDAARRLRAPPAFEPPVPYAWLEFEAPRISLRDPRAGVRAILVSPDPRIRARSHVRLFVDRERCAAATVDPPAGWGWDGGPCPSRAPCPIAELHGGWMTARLALPNAGTCACARSFAGLMTYLAVLTALLRAEGVEHTVVERPAAAGPARARPGGRADAPPRPAAVGGDAPGATAGAPPAARWVRLSLSARGHVVRARGTDGLVLADGVAEGPRSDACDAPDPPDAGGAGEGRRGTLRAQVATHPRLLIPGPGKPWRGEVPRVVWVRGHERRVHGVVAVRFRVGP